MNATDATTPSEPPEKPDSRPDGTAKTGTYSAACATCGRLLEITGNILIGHHH